ncbi:hypothetical protein ACFSJY_02235 [Thalassotalea euphylliae]|uniref:hypothetical protein n=1 Tax=Thalassotalea euphylliae TaxID=1655234 RepID=UPI0036346998
MAKQAANGHTDSPELSNQLGQLRDILFGEDKREFEAHFQSIEKTTTSQLDQLTNYINQELNALRDDIEKQFAAMANQISDNDHLHSEREDQLQSFAESTANQLANFEKKTEQASNNLQKQLSDDKQQLARQLEEQFTTLNEKIDTLGASLDDNKADRNLLADILTQAAERVRLQPESDNAEQ